MSGEHIAIPYTPPPAHHPTAEQGRALDAFAGRVLSLLQGALSRAGAGCAPASDPGLTWEPAPLWELEWATQAAWTQAARWRLLLAEGATEALLAAHLGQDSLAQHALTDLDLRLLELPVGSLVAGLAAELPASGSSPEVTMSRGGAPAETAPAVAWSVVVRHGPAEGQALLVAPWDELSPVISPPADEQRLRTADLQHAPVTVEAITAAGHLTPRELLDMQPGDVLDLGPAEQLSLLLANGRAFARGRPGAKGTHLAMSIHELNSPDTREG